MTHVAIFVEHMSDPSCPRTDRRISESRDISVDDPPALEGDPAPTLAMGARPLAVHFEHRTMLIVDIPCGPDNI